MFSWLALTVVISLSFNLARPRFRADIRRKTIASIPDEHLVTQQ